MYTQLQETTQKQKQAARVPVARENIATAHNEMLRMSTMVKSGMHNCQVKPPNMQTMPITLGGSKPHLIHGFVIPPESISQMAP